MRGENSATHWGDYPRTVPCEDVEIELRPFAEGDEAAVLAFARTLPEPDLLFLPRDITHPKVVAAWQHEIAEGHMHGVLAWAGDEVVVSSAVVRDPLSWSPHVGEIRVVVTPEMRGKGLGRLMVQESFVTALELGLKKLMARMTTDQRGAIAVFEELGFRGEALLQNQVRGRDGTEYDIAILSHDVRGVQAQMELYGLTEALE